MFKNSIVSLVPISRFLSHSSGISNNTFMRLHWLFAKRISCMVFVLLGQELDV